MTSIRDRFKPIAVDRMKKQAEKENQEIYEGGSADYISLKENKFTKIRLFPAHPGEENFYITKKVRWVSVEKDDGTSGRRQIPDAVLHGGLKHDIIEEYVNEATKLLKSLKDSEANEKIALMNHWKDGLKPTFSWVAWAKEVNSEDESIKLFEFKKQIRDQINELAMSEDDDDPIEFDPYTDPDQGKCIKIKYNPKPDKKKGEINYKVVMGDVVPLTDEELEDFESKDTLSSKFRNNYTLSLFETAMEGIRNFDEENEIGLFEDAEWLEKVERLKQEAEEVLSKDDDSPKKSKKSEKEKSKKSTPPAPAKSKKPDPEEEPEELDDEELEEAEELSGDEFDSMDRTELKRWIVANGLKEVIIVKAKWSDDELREEIRMALTPAEDDAEEVEEVEEVEEPKNKGGKLSLQDLKSRLAKK
jgi:hypothetical protein